jgi:hypothetical protein
MTRSRKLPTPAPRSAYRSGLRLKRRLSAPFDFITLCNIKDAVAIAVSYVKQEVQTALKLDSPYRPHLGPTWPTLL